MLFVKSIPGVFALAVFVCLPFNAAAQSTLFNIPSTDVVAKKKVYLEFDFISHFESHQNGGFQAYVPRGVVGLGKGTEVGLNVAFLDTLAPDQPVEFQPNVKHQFYSNEGGVTVSAGGILYLPVAHRSGTDTFGMIYTVVSKQVKATYGPRVTGGAYGLVGRNRWNWNKRRGNSRVRAADCSRQSQLCRGLAEWKKPIRLCDAGSINRSFKDEFSLYRLQHWKSGSKEQRSLSLLRHYLLVKGVSSDKPTSKTRPI
jgi:hypothetical protein